jgi:hypothetical protein
MSDTTTHNTGALDDVMKVAFRHQKTTTDMIAAVKAAKGEGFEYKDLQRQFYIGELAGTLHPTAPKPTQGMVEEAGRILDLKTYKKDGDPAEYRTKEQQRLCTSLRKAWQRIAAAAGLDAIDNRGGGANTSPARGGVRVSGNAVIRLSRITPPTAKSMDEVVEFTLDLASLVQKYVETNSRMIPPELRPVFATFLQGMAFAAYAPKETKAA